MNKLDTEFIKTAEQNELLQKADQLAANFANYSKEIDHKGRFPFENFEAIKEADLYTLTIPKKYGGPEASLYDILLLQEKLAQGDASTALSFGWHIGIIKNLYENHKWSEDAFKRLCYEVMNSHILINAAGSEAATGSPARGGKPETSAEKHQGKWVINGRKTFTTMAPALHYAIVSATIEETGEVGDFLVPMSQAGVYIEEAWDTLGMRGTRSDDLVLDQVVVKDHALVEIKSDDKKPQGWLLHIPACYSGIAIAARNEAVEFAREYQPNSLPGPIMDVPEVQRKVGLMDIEILKARHFMYAVADKWDQFPQERANMDLELSAVKYAVTNMAVEVVDLAMRIVGGQSLFKSNKLERLYRDVRAGLHNPPADDITLSIFGKRAFTE